MTLMNDLKKEDPRIYQLIKDEEEYWQDLLKVTGGQTNEKLARMVIRESSTCRDWMRKHGVNFQPPLSGTLHVARTNAFFMGGGKALVNSYFSLNGTQTL